MAVRRDICAKNELEKKTGIGVFFSMKDDTLPTKIPAGNARGLQAEFLECDCL